MFLTDDELRDSVASVLKLSNKANLQQPWFQHTTDGNAMAYSDIVDALLKREYTMTQIQAWNRGKIIQRLQGLYWSFTMGAGLHPYSETFIKQWDQRKALETMAVETSGDDGQSPAQEPAVGFGLLRTDNDRWNEENFPM